MACVLLTGPQVDKGPSAICKGILLAGSRMVRNLKDTRAVVPRFDPSERTSSSWPEAKTDYLIAVITKKESRT